MSVRLLMFEKEIFVKFLNGFGNTFNKLLWTCSLKLANIIWTTNESSQFEIELWVDALTKYHWSAVWALTTYVPESLKVCENSKVEPDGFNSVQSLIFPSPQSIRRARLSLLGSVPKPESIKILLDVPLVPSNSEISGVLFQV